MGNRVRRTAHRGGQERGAAVVEFAIVLPLLTMLVLGLISAGISYNRKMQLTHAAREGARYGAAVPMDQQVSSGTWASNVRDVVIERSSGDLSITDDICVALVEGVTPVPVSAQHTTSGGACFDDSGGGEAARRVQVRVSRPETFNALVVKLELTLTSEAAARHEG